LKVVSGIIGVVGEILEGAALVLVLRVVILLLRWRQELSEQAVLTSFWMAKAVDAGICALVLAHVIYFQVALARILRRSWSATAATGFLKLPRSTGVPGIVVWIVSNDDLGPLAILILIDRQDELRVCLVG